MLGVFFVNVSGLCDHRHLNCYQGVLCIVVSHNAWHSLVTIWGLWCDTARNVGRNFLSCYSTTSAHRFRMVAFNCCSRELLGSIFDINIGFIIYGASSLILQPHYVQNQTGGTRTAAFCKTWKPSEPSSQKWHIFRSFKPNVTPLVMYCKLTQWMQPSLYFYMLVPFPNWYPRPREITIRICFIFGISVAKNSIASEIAPPVGQQLSQDSPWSCTKCDTRLCCLCYYQKRDLDPCVFSIFINIPNWY